MIRCKGFHRPSQSIFRETAASAPPGIRCFSHHKEEETPRREEQQPPKHDQIGPPDPVTNLRQVRLHIPPNESKLHERYRLLREDTHRWNDKFWRRHNRAFARGKEDFVAKVLKERYPGEPGKNTVTAEEMSEFYREHLNSKWRLHLDYNLEWQHRNFRILGLSFLVALENLFRR